MLPLVVTVVVAVGWVCGYFWLADRREACEARLRTPTQEVALLLDGGFHPRRVSVREGLPVRLRLTRTRDREGWWDDFEFPYRRIVHEMPEGQTVTVDVGALKAGEYAIFCAQGTLRGTLEAGGRPEGALGPGPVTSQLSPRRLRTSNREESMSTPRRPTLRHPVLLSLALVALAAAPCSGQAHAGMPMTHARAHMAHPAPAADSAAVAGAVRAFHAALHAQDTAAVLALLAEDVIVVESGSVETREEYLAHHLAADMAFAGAVAQEAGAIAVTQVGDVAWAVSSSRTRGTYRDRPIDSVGAELMVLTRHADGWRIRAIHWSSHSAR